MAPGRVTVQIPVELKPRERGTIYTLKAVLVRMQGNETTASRGGHYVCIMLDGNDVRAYNDEEVVRLDTSKGGAENALNTLLREEDYRPYSLLYEKMT